jgi:pimeloyl-ACP methyl ester carboxylesterase
LTPTVVFVHGGWVTPACWDPFVSFFQERGYGCLAPAWPGKDRPIEAIRRDPSPLAGLGIGEIVDHYERIVRALGEPPILIGHSFGGLFVQVLLDRGLGAAGVAIDSAAPKGVLTFALTSLLATGRVLLIPFGWRKVVRWSFPEFRYGFVHTMPIDQARAAYAAHIVPDTGRPYFQAAFAMFDRTSPARVNFWNPQRAPLLFVAGEADRAMTPAIVRRVVRAHQASPARTDLRTLPGRTHWLIAQEGWEEVAATCIEWLGSIPGLESPGKTPAPEIERRWADGSRHPLVQAAVRGEEP